jgi:hypothetical protein
MFDLSDVSDKILRYFHIHVILKVAMKVQVHVPSMGFLLN